MEDSKNMEDVDDEMGDIDREIEELQIKKKKIKRVRGKKGRMRCNNYGRPNKPMRVDSAFKKMVEDINKERKDNGRERLSLTMITRLVAKHNKYSNLLCNSIILYNTDLDEEEEFNDN